MESKIPRPEGFVENPYIGKDGKDYHSIAALSQADTEYYRQMFKQTKLDLPSNWDNQGVINDVSQIDF